MATANRDALLARRYTTETGFLEEEVEIPGFGTVRVRQLSRFEVFHLASVQDKGPGPVERFIIAQGMVDPVMSEDDVKQWQKVAPIGELQPVVEAINRLSGTTPDAQKQAFLDFEADPGSEFRLLPGGEVGDASESDPSGSEQ